MDAQDKTRTLSNRDKLLAALKSRGVITNHQAREIAGSRAMGRCFELQQAGEPITVRKVNRSTWELRYDVPALGRDAVSQKSGQRTLPLPGIGRSF